MWLNRLGHYFFFYFNLLKIQSSKYLTIGKVKVDYYDTQFVGKPMHYRAQKIKALNSVYEKENNILIDGYLGSKVSSDTILLKCLRKPTEIN